MRDFCRTYESAPEIMVEALTIGCTQNIVIMEAELLLQEKAWYIRAVQKFGWSKLDLIKQIASTTHLEITLDLTEKVCYTGENGSLVYFPSKTQADGIWHRPCRKNSAVTHPLRLRQLRSLNWDVSGKHIEYSPYLRQRLRRQEVLTGHVLKLAS